MSMPRIDALLLLVNIATLTYKPISWLSQPGTLFIENSGPLRSMEPRVHAVRQLLRKLDQPRAMLVRTDRRQIRNTVGKHKETMDIPDAVPDLWC
jgi:hypothetical protein